MKLKLTALSLLIVSSAIQAQPTIADLFQSIKHYHPLALEKASKRQAVSFQQLEAESAFDLQIEQNSKFRLNGYYDGQYLSQQVSKRLNFMNAEVFGEHRISDGEFPVYEQEYDTLSAGEVNVGVKLSLLQNRDINQFGIAVNNSQFEFAKSQAEEILYLNQLLAKGISAYLDWYQATLYKNIIDDLVTATEQRQQAIETRVNNGDLAEITLTEFNTTLLKRKISLQKAQRTLTLAQQALTFYWRDNYGQMYNVNKIGEAPNQLNWPLGVNNINDFQQQQIIAKHPLLTAKQNLLSQAKNELVLADNKLLPKLDFEFKLARDLGNGKESLMGTEPKVGLKFTMPLGQRAAKAQKSQKQEKIKQIEYSIQASKDQINQNIQQVINALNYARSLFKLEKQQAQVAEKLLQQENIRFDAGASNLFLLNTRESQSFEAKLNSIKAKIAVKKQELKLWAVTAKLNNLTL